ncbi:LPXTG cell wall anchor domain-containing protein [Enterococcus haemoperoxidus]|nr:LPXTG cell wall anchor domain-containing protein [Enterococcus haemoperoxidus]
MSKKIQFIVLIGMFFVGMNFPNEVLAAGYSSTVGITFIDDEQSVAQIDTMDKNQKLSIKEKTDYLPKTGEETNYYFTIAGVLLISILNINYINKSRKKGTT